MRPKRFSALDATWLWVLAALLLGGIGFLSYRRGTKLAPPTAPASATDGARCGLIAEHRIRCLVLANASLDSVWNLITDYSRFPELFRSPFFAFELSGHEQRAPGHFRLTGAVSGLMQRYPFVIETTHVRLPALSAVSWEQMSGALSTDRGGWTLQPRSSSETLITYEIEAVMPGAPRFIVNDVLLDALRTGLEHLAEVAATQAAK